MKRVAFYVNQKFTASINLDVEMLRSKFELQTHGDDADYVLCWKSRPPRVPAERCVILQAEPPHARDVVETYVNARGFAAFFCFDPAWVDGAFPISSDPLCYPYRPGVKDALPTRSSVGSDIRFYFAGKKGRWEKQERFGAACLYETRYLIASAIEQRYPGSLIIGDGFAESTKQSSLGWRAAKLVDVQRVDANFIFCCENYALRNYFSEKIHDGFRSGCVFAYLGAPNVDALVPADCFVDVRACLGQAASEPAALFDCIESISDEAYARMTRNARNYFQGFDARFARAKEDLTRRIIDVLDCR